LSPPRRSARAVLISVLLVLALGLAGLLAFNAEATFREHRATAERVLRDYARLAAARFAQRTAQNLYYMACWPVVEAFTRSGAGTRPDHLPTPAALAAGLDSVPAAFVRHARYAFRLNLRSGQLVTAGAAPSAAVRRWLKDTLPLHLEAVYMKEEHVAALVASVDGAARLVGYTLATPARPRGAAALLGADVGARASAACATAVLARRAPAHGRPHRHRAGAAAPRVRPGAAAHGFRVGGLARAANAARADPHVRRDAAPRPRAQRRRAPPLARDHRPGSAPAHASRREPAALLALRAASPPRRARAHVDGAADPVGRRGVRSAGGAAPRAAPGRHRRRRRRRGGPRGVPPDAAHPPRQRREVRPRGSIGHRHPGPAGCRGPRAGHRRRPGARDPPAERERIWERFWRLERDRGSAVGGTGHGPAGGGALGGLAAGRA